MEKKAVRGVDLDHPGTRLAGPLSGGAERPDDFSDVLGAHLGRRGPALGVRDPARTHSGPRLLTALQSEYSLWTRDIEAEILPTLDELGIALVPFSLLQGLPHRHRRHDGRVPGGDIRATIPRFTQENHAANQALLDLVTQVATAHDATPAQVALVWLLTQRPSITPIPGTRRLQRRDENIGATELDLSRTASPPSARQQPDWASQALGTTRRCSA